MMASALTMRSEFLKDKWKKLPSGELRNEKRTWHSPHSTSNSHASYQNSLCYFVSDGYAVKSVNEPKVNWGEVNHGVAKIKGTESNVENDEDNILQRLVPARDALAGTGGQLADNLQEFLLKAVLVVFFLWSLHYCGYYVFCIDKYLILKLESNYLFIRNLSFSIRHFIFIRPKYYYAIFWIISLLKT